MECLQEDAKEDQLIAETGSVVFKVRDITKSHYVPRSSRSSCQNKLCRISFSKTSFNRPRHCRRCGEIFCMTCLGYKRRLNVMAQPDPQGVLCKVCLSCFEDDPLDLVCTTRSHTQMFQQFRNQSKEEITDSPQDNVVGPMNASEQTDIRKERINVDISKECQRLLQGFKSSASRFETLNTLRRYRGHFSTPAWQRSMFMTQDRETSMCQYCCRKLKRRKRMRSCRVCGLTLCKACSYKELLLYFEDGTKDINAASPHLSIIRFTGCPDVEPHISELLYCCLECKEEILNRQINNNTWYMEQTNQIDIISEIVRVDYKFRELTEEIGDNMDILLAELDIINEMKNCRTRDENILAQSEDVTSKQELVQSLKDGVNDKLDVFWNTFLELQSTIKHSNCKPTCKRKELLKNYLSARTKFYLETRSRLIAKYKDGDGHFIVTSEI